MTSIDRNQSKGFIFLLFPFKQGHCPYSFQPFLKATFFDLDKYSKPECWIIHSETWEKIKDGLCAAHT